MSNLASSIGLDALLGLLGLLGMLEGFGPLLALLLGATLPAGFFMASRLAGRFMVKVKI